MEAMKPTSYEIESLEDWLTSHLDTLVDHGEKVRDLLNSAEPAKGIINASMEFVLSTSAVQPDALSPQQIAVWKSLLPILAEHALLAVRSGTPPLDGERTMTKLEAAKFLGFSIAKLNRCMAKRLVTFEKHGAGRTAGVRFRRSDLEKFEESRRVPCRGNSKQGG